MTPYVYRINPRIKSRARIDALWLAYIWLAGEARDSRNEARITIARGFAKAARDLVTAFGVRV